MREAEDIGSRIMTGHIKTHAFSADHREVQVCDDQLIAVENGLDNVGRIRRNNTTSSPFNPFVSSAMRELVRDIGDRHHEANGHHKASTLEGIVAASQLRYLVYRRPDGDVDVLFGLMHSHACKRHPVFPANQSPHTCSSDINRLQATAVTVAPHKAFGECRHEFSMMVRQVAIW